jgi:hypothetical protein
MEVLRNLYSLPSIDRVVKSRRVGGKELGAQKHEVSTNFGCTRNHIK